jgi:hypothetical protein
MQVLKLFKLPLLFFFAGILITLFGSWAKIMHYSFADTALTAGLIVKGITVVAAIYILVKSKN